MRGNAGYNEENILDKEGLSMQMSSCPKNTEVLLNGNRQVRAKPEAKPCCRSVELGFMLR
jgi:hypothetical protein